MRTIGIIGAGASGMAAAIAAAECGNTRVFLLEHMDRPGKKLLSTGNGRCNLTNEKMDASYFRSENMSSIQSVLKSFGYEDTLQFFEKLGLMIKSRGGYIYPACGQASAVRDILCMKLESLHAEVYTGIHVTKFYRERDKFCILGDDTADGRFKKRKFYADKVILSTGGRAAGALGSDGSGYELLRMAGHSLVPVVPALVQLKVKQHPFAKASGVRADASVTALVDGRELFRDTGELQITTYGISGIPVFQISRFIAKALHERKRAEVVIDFLPSMDSSAFETCLMERVYGRENMELCDFLTGIFHSKLIPRLLELSGIKVHTKVKELPLKKIRQLVRQCKHTVLEIKDTNGYENAQVCAGGAALCELDERTMESRIVPGLYLTGELLDADGMCGGYNLQWAWATGYLAGKHAAE